MHLSSTSATVAVVTSGAGTVDVHASWVDLDTGTSDVVPSSDNTAITTATTTTVVGSPASSNIRKVEFLTVENKSATVAQTLTVRHNDGTTTSDLLTVSLLPGYGLQYNIGNGWTLRDASGAVITNPTGSASRIAEALLTGNKRVELLKVGTAPKAAGAFHSMWLATPSAGAASPAYTAGSGYTASQATAGALPLTNATVKNRIAALRAGMSVAGSLLLADRLWSCSGMGFAAATYTVTTPGSLPARITDNGAGCMVFIEQFVPTGAWSGTITLNYVNAAGSSVSSVIPAAVSAPVAGQMQRFPISDGIRSVTSVVTSATATSGSFGVTIVKPILEIECLLANIFNTFDWQKTGLAEILNDACPMLIQQATATTATTIYGQANVIDL
jgi:hypothetical protein